MQVDNLSTWHFVGWNRVLEALSHACVTAGAKTQALALRPYASSPEIESAYGQVQALSQLLDQSASLPLEDIEDLTLYVGRVQRGSLLEIAELFEVTRTIRCMARSRRFLSHHAEQLGALEALSGNIPDVTLLASELEATFTAHGEIRDDATPELAQARRQMTRLTTQIKKRLEQYLRKHDIEAYLQDDYYTVREGRYVLPIVSSFQGKLNGIIHGTSNSGQTVFLEPGEFIESNNELKMAEAAVTQALRAILSERAEWLAEEAPALIAGMQALVELDVLSARAQLGRQLNATIPVFNAEGRIKLIGARSPILALGEQEVVANDILLDAEHAFVVVSGPNTGGKTVTLQTVGCMTLMAHSAIPIPADSGSEVAHFERLVALGGDAQDIDRALSTFSGHMTAVRDVLEAAGPGSMVLLDEIATGTEPEQGAALGIAVMEALAAAGARGFVTTHYERLKLLAFGDPRFANASVGVDPKTSRPDYRLRFGEPGASNPMDVVERLGFPSALVDRARSIIHGDLDVSAAISALSQARDAALAAELEAKKQNESLEDERRQLKERLTQLKAQSAQEIARLTAEAQQEISDALELVREQVRDIQSVNDPRMLEGKRRRIIATQASLSAPSPSPDDRTPEPPKPAITHARQEADVTPGARVWHVALKQEALIVEFRNDREVVVAIGAMRMTVKRSQLSAIPKDRLQSKKAKPAQTVSARTHAPEERDDADIETPPMRTDRITLDLRGIRRHEVLDLLNQFLDRAYLNNEEAVWIIHGYGTGAVRQEVRSLVRQSSYIRFWRAGRSHEGSDGVTIAWLQKG